MKKITIKRIAFIAIFSAISTILYCYVKFPLPIFPSFLDINFSMIPIIICAFMIGPWDACAVIVLRCLLKWILPPGSSTGYVGELADVLICLAATIPCGLIYHKSNNERKTLFAFLALALGWVIMAVISNIFINIPWYIHLYFNGDINPLIGICNQAFSVISFGNIKANADNFMLWYVLLAVIPFNLLLSLIVIIITLPVHKRLKDLYDMIN